MKKVASILGGGVATLLAVGMSGVAIVMAFAMGAMMLIGALGGAGGHQDAENNSGGDCLVSGGEGRFVPTTMTQVGYVRTLIGVAKGLKVPEQGQVIGVMVLMQETGAHMYANDGSQKDWGSSYPPPGTEFWLNLARLSLNMPHDKGFVAHDADSIGLMGQRASMGWADDAHFKAQSNPKEAASRLLSPVWDFAQFFGGPQGSPDRGLLDVSGWQSMAPTVAAQTVQGSAFPSAYAKWQAQATQMVSKNQDAPTINPYDSSGNPAPVPSSSAASSSAAPNRTPSKAANAVWHEPKLPDATLHPKGGLEAHGFTAQDAVYATNGSVVQEAGFAEHPPPSIPASEMSSLLSKTPKPGSGSKSGSASGSKSGSKSGSASSSSAADIPTTGCGAGGAGDPGVATGTAADIIAWGKKVLHTPYSWGGGSPQGPTYGINSGGIDGTGVKGFDCSSLVQYMVYNGGHLMLPRTASAQYQATKAHTVSWDELQPGDLMFWGDASFQHHVAMYVGNGVTISENHPGGDADFRPAYKGDDFFAATRLTFADNGSDPSDSSSSKPSTTKPPAKKSVYDVPAPQSTATLVAAPGIVDPRARREN